MLQFFNSIYNFIKGILGFVFMILDHIIKFIVNIPKYLSFVLKLFGLVPQFLQPFVIAGVTYFVVDLIYKKVRGVQ